MQANKKSKIIRIAYIVIGCIFLATASFFGGYATHCASQDEATKKIQEILSIIDKDSVFKVDLTPDELAESVANSLLINDRYARYYTQEEYDVQTAEDQGNYGGTGMTFLTDGNGNLLEGVGIYSVVKNSPAYKAGIKAGDMITAGKVGDNDYTWFKSNAELLTFLKSLNLGDKILVRVTRDGVFTHQEFQLEKKQYVCAMVVYKDSECSLDFTYGDEQEEKLDYNGKMESLANDTAYIQLDEFTGNASTEFGRAMQFMKERGRTKLILDLRNNGGGFLTELCKIASYLIYNNGAKKSVVACSVSNYDEVKYTTNANNFNTNIQKITVLANGNTASASECLIGAMLHYKDAFSMENLVLTSFNSSRNNHSTYGKGIAQRTYNLSGGSALKLTYAKMYWPDYTTCIQDVGIVQSEKNNCVADEFAIDRAIEILK